MCPETVPEYLRITSSTRTSVRVLGAASCSGSTTKRGSTSGTLTRANFVRPAWRTTTAFLLRLEMSGNGWPGSKASGVRTGQISREK